MSFIYKDNDQLKREIKKLIIDANMTQRQVCEKVGYKPQQMTNVLNKGNLSFKDIKRIANVLELDIRIEFVPIDKP